MPKYDHQKIEKKWKKVWAKSGIYKTKNTSDRPKYYILDMFPYPSGAGLHVGHPKGYIATDVIARMKMMQGYNVLHPMGWDAFGLPTENYALEHKVHPREATEKNIKTFKKQLGSLGLTYDWDREVNTTDPEYYKWTQWIFLQMFKKGLAYESYEPINWCPICQTGLANEDLEDGKCERCGTVVEKKPVRQWVLKITKYADRLLNDLDKLDKWPEPIKEMQRNWIGRSEGAVVRFIVIPTEARGRVEESLEVFTTRPDTLFGATYMVVAPEHAIISKLKDQISNIDEVDKYIATAKKKTDLERTDLTKDKIGVELKGVKAINPVNGDKLPIFVADYVITGYGTGAIMSVPAHDERDWEFAKKYNLSIKKVVKGGEEECFSGLGIAVNSGFLDGLPTLEAKEKMDKWLEEKGVGQRKVQYKLRDWVFSRQRYWGEPIPLVHCENCQKKKQKVLIIHGLTGRADKNWMPFMKKKLEEIGFEVFVPTMTTSEHPVMEKWLEELLPIIKDFGENDVIVGHSLGGSAALHLLEKINKNIGHLYLVAPAVGKLSEEEWQKKKLKRPDRDYDRARILWELPVDWLKILNKVKHATILYSNNDPSIKALGYDFWPRNWDIKFLGQYGHFTDMGFDALFEDFRRSRITGWIPVPENELPVELPKVKNYEPTGTGESPLANIHKWVNTKCPVCGGKAKRETNTMPQWAGSCWYYLRYIDPKNDKALIDKEKEKYWSPVDFYVGGAEHATRHLIYARFWHKFLYDIGAVNYDEPFTRLQNVGLILAEDGRKMSKRWGNVINPDDIVEKFGADAMRVYEMFMGPFDQPCAWSTQGLVGAKRFLEKVWALQGKVVQNVIPTEGRGRVEEPLKKGSLDYARDDRRRLTTILHQTIKKVSDDIEDMRFNTAIAKLMELTNEMGKEEDLSEKYLSILVKLLSPFAPHLSEDIWNTLGHKGSIFAESWPKHDSELAKDSEITLAVQINGKLRDTIVVSADISEVEAKKLVLASEKTQKWLAGQKPKKVIYIKGKLVSIVV